MNNCVSPTGHHYKKRMSKMTITSTSFAKMKKPSYKHKASDLRLNPTINSSIKSFVHQNSFTTTIQESEEGNFFINSMTFF